MVSAAGAGALWWSAISSCAIDDLMGVYVRYKVKEELKLAADVGINSKSRSIRHLSAAGRHALGAKKAFN